MFLNLNYRFINFLIIINYIFKYRVKVRTESAATSAALVIKQKIHYGVQSRPRRRPRRRPHAADWRVIAAITPTRRPREANGVMVGNVGTKRN